MQFIETDQHADQLGLVSHPAVEGRYLSSRLDATRRDTHTGQTIRPPFVESTLDADAIENRFIKGKAIFKMGIRHSSVSLPTDGIDQCVFLLTCLLKCTCFVREKHPSKRVKKEVFLIPNGGHMRDFQLPGNSDSGHCSYFGYTKFPLRIFGDPNTANHSFFTLFGGCGLG